MSVWEIAKVREQGQVFAIVAVKDHVINSPSERDGVIALWTGQLGCRVALLGAQQYRTYGPHDIVRWMQGVHPGRLPWQRVTLAA
ncbi:hypothetical protein [Xanthobacter sediminis]